HPAFQGWGSGVEAWNGLVTVLLPYGVDDPALLDALRAAMPADRLRIEHRPEGEHIGFTEGRGTAPLRIGKTIGIGGGLCTEGFKFFIGSNTNVVGSTAGHCAPGGNG